MSLAANFICLCSREARHDCSLFVGPSWFVRRFRSGRLRRQRRPAVLRQPGLHSELFFCHYKNLFVFVSQYSRFCGPTLMPRVLSIFGRSLHHPRTPPLDVLWRCQRRSARLLSFALFCERRPHRPREISSTTARWSLPRLAQPVD